MWAICNLIMHVAVECLASARQNLRPCYSGNSHLGLNAFLIHLLTMTCELFFVRTAVHREEGIWARADWPDVKPIRPFRNLWLAATRSDTGLVGAGIFGAPVTTNPPPWFAKTAHRGRFERLSVASSVGHIPRNYGGPMAAHRMQWPCRRFER
jgi:hypothetical protein